MKNQITLRKQRVSFTQVPNDLICNPEISSLAKSLWCVLYSKPDNWTFFWGEILTHLKEGRDAIKKASKELEEFGYLCKKQLKQNSNGKMIFSGMEIELFYEPQNPPMQENQGHFPITDFQLTETPSSEIPLTENQSTDKYLYKKDLSNKNLKNKPFSFLAKNPPKKKSLTLEEAEIYKKEKNYQSDVEGFIDYYQPKGWKGIEDAYCALDAWERKFKKLNSDLNQNHTTENIGQVPEQDNQINIAILLSGIAGYFRSEKEKLDYKILFKNNKDGIEAIKNGFLMSCSFEQENLLKTHYSRILERFKIELKTVAA